MIYDLFIFDAGFSSLHRSFWGKIRNN